MLPTWLTPLLAPIAACIAPLLNWIAGRSSSANTPAMQANQEKVNEQVSIDKARKDIADGNIGNIRNDNS
jgi:hypothetical protein